MLRVTDFYGEDLPYSPWPHPIYKSYDPRIPSRDLSGSTLAAGLVRLPLFVWCNSPNIHRLGYNIEQMDKYIPIQTFDHIYLVDLCEPLLRVARERFERKGWKNITILCQDACNFNLPEWKDGIDPKGSVSLVTLSYSLSMVRFLTLRLSKRF